MVCIVVKFQTPGYNTFRDMIFFSSLIFGQVHTDRQMDRRKAMHMSPPCIGAGGLNELADSLARHCEFLDPIKVTEMGK